MKYVEESSSVDNSPQHIKQTGKKVDEFVVWGLVGWAFAVLIHPRPEQYNTAHPHKYYEALQAESWPKYRGWLKCDDCSGKSITVWYLRKIVYSEPKVMANADVFSNPIRY